MLTSALARRGYHDSQSVTRRSAAMTRSSSKRTRHLAVLRGLANSSSARNPSTKNSVMSPSCLRRIRRTAPQSRGKKKECVESVLEQLTVEQHSNIVAVGIVRSGAMRTTFLKGKSINNTNQNTISCHPKSIAKYNIKLAKLMGQLQIFRYSFLLARIVESVRSNVR